MNGAVQVSLANTKPREPDNNANAIEATPIDNPPLPKGCKPLAHQVAGHRYGQGRTKIGMLQHVDGTILKPVQSPPRGQCELDFYAKVFDEETKDPVLLTIRPFLPKYHGKYCPPCTDHYTSPCNYIKLEDACKRFKNPSILDIKVGRVTYDPHADAEKIEIETSKYPPLKELGFQILGMRISGPSPSEAVFYDKKFGRSFTPDSISEGEFIDGSSDSDEEFIHKYRYMHPKLMPEYFNTINSVLKTNIEAKNKQNIPVIATQGNETNQSSGTTNHNNSNQITTGGESGYASEADSKKKSAEVAIQQEFVTRLCNRLQSSSITTDKYRFPPDLVDVRMIDFTHVFEEPTEDCNYLYGLRSLISHFKYLLKQS